ncbi:PREDICTED: little elongation complex subunit 2-like isoform X3 [Vollenhovia emeryi]|uniref:little elongation complex subunit 2-like isoform X3 n=1 Tax=Vollenhovia emeryi TaxID=411798 RepID=UPI0005F49218|nr:PREDICTED: little elongation complex subunit 2-like isoform X3 [Vollenhovia emeryi]
MRKQYLLNMEERFRNLDWHPALEDMIDNVFIRDERMERESAMYKIMNDNFKNPFENIESEYADVDVELIKKHLFEDGEVFADSQDEEQVKHEDSSSMQEQKKLYVPGIRVSPVPFPRKSELTMAQQAMCLRVLLRFSSIERGPMNEKEREEYEEYMTLKRIINQEQQEFLEFVKNQWDETFKWRIKCNKFVALKWKAKAHRYRTLPQYYVESTNISLCVQKVNLTNKDIRAVFTSCLQQEALPKVILPTLDRPQKLFVDTVKLLERYPPCVTHQVTQHFRLPVSEDMYCESLAREAEADFVISSSGLKCLLNNIDPNYSNTWLIPIVVKSYGGKKVVYVDKKLPPTTATIQQKNTWVYKYILRHYFVNESESSKKLGPSLEFLQQEKMSGVKEYKMLVRTKTDGIEMLPNQESQTLILAPKMEHQLAYGAEAVTLDEGMQQWISLKFRPKALLARVRIATDTAEIIQIERHTSLSVSKDLKRLHNVKVQDSLSILHNIIEELSSLTPGQYIIRHVPQNGPFACVYKPVNHRKNVFDLHAMYKSMTYETISKFPWPPIDIMMTTPAIKCYKKMPAMFKPSFKVSKTPSGRPRGRPKKNTNVTSNNKVPVSLRRSTRQIINKTKT